MDTLLIIILVAFIAGVVLSGRRPSREPQIIYVATEPEQRGGGCLVPLVFAAIVVILLFTLR